VCACVVDQPVRMGQKQSGLPPGAGRDGNKKKQEEKKRKYEPPIPTRVGRKKKTRGPDTANKLPQGEPRPDCCMPFYEDA
jgi:26S proteasome regulatory subunit T2